MRGESNGKGRGECEDVEIIVAVVVAAATIVEVLEGRVEETIK